MILGQLCIALVAILHIGFLVLEMFLWDKPLGMKVFGNTPQKAPTDQSTCAKSGSV